ncbi:ATP-binding protein [Rhodoferax sp.]|uniref:ATP-binding protein n=1 Tax=Rhodoferax sp. TaxID=50421 RepID=UPI002729EAE8|nr:ATP-binding protein [Rhodoferax sp.]
MQNPLTALRRWRISSLANTFALQAAFIAIASIVVVALMSLTVIYWVEARTQHERLQEKSGRVAERLEASINVVESSATALAKNPMFMTALLDSKGRDSYVVPFLENYNFPIAAASGLALCDINGSRMAGTRSPLSNCRPDSPLFKQAMTDGKALRELIPLANGHIGWTVYQGVVFGYTGTVEGVVVTQLDLHDVLQSVPKDLDLTGVALQRTGSKQSLGNVPETQAGSAAEQQASTALFKDRPEAMPYPMEVVARDRLQPFGNKLLPLGLGYGLAGLLLVLLVIYWARSVSRGLIAPLTALTDSAHRVAQTGDLSIAVPQTNAGEVAQLAKAFEVMVNAVRASESSLEEKVTLRTAELEQSQTATRDRTEQLNAIFDLSPDGFVSFDAGLRVTFANRAFLRMTGTEAGDIMGLDEAEFSSLLAHKCLPQATFPGVATLRAARKNLREGEAEMPLIKTRHCLIELAGPGNRVLAVGLRLSQAENVSQILYLRDVTHETEVDRMKSEFLSTAAHELRTPMASIYGYCELLMMRDFDENERQEMLSTIFRQSELMASIINELLDLARIEARRGKDFVLERLSLQELVSEAVMGYKLPEGRDAPLIQTSDETLIVRVDRKKIQQALLNVLSNAYKYSPRGGAISVSFLQEVHHSVGRFGIEVRDHGIGMRREELARVFERFYRADSTGKFPGTGLGMSIVREIIEIHGGEVSVESRLGEGTTVTLWLPAA